jgi:hypothetical protein
MSATTEICGTITGKHFRQFGRPVVMDYLNSSGQPEKCDKCATLGQNQEKSTATMRRKLCEAADQMLRLPETRPASQRVGLSEVPGNQLGPG